MIVTENLRLFPDAALRPHRLAALTPDTFLTELDAFAPRRMAAILVAQGAGLRGQWSLFQVLDALCTQPPTVVAIVEAARAKPGRG
ncbi:MAG TPA: hypothetical protein VFL91_04095 [Thermomicrobiales bacterium]|nr:hypothetical protein [Thermomicrobiales bacterium]